MAIENQSGRTDGNSEGAEGISLESHIFEFADRNKVIACLHFISGLVLLCYGISHLAFLSLKSFSLEFSFANAVFPFLSNHALYECAGITEILIGLCCVFYGGCDIINVLILTFVGVIAWYRWAFFFAGGHQCNCLGMLGTLLHLSKREEKAIPLLTLILLTTTTLPWSLRLARFALKKISAAFPLALLLGAMAQSQAQEVMELHGEVNAARYNPVLGTPYTNTAAHIEFSVVMSEKNWMICATNANDPVFWAQVFYDGTNLYTLCPKDADFWIGQRPQDNTVFATISPTPLYIAPVDDTLGVACIYVTYILSSNAIPQSDGGIARMPLPWLTGRKTLKAYGDKWLIDASRGRFLEDFTVVREHALDLPEKDEFARWEVDYPMTSGDRDWFRELVASRRMVPEGFVEARYKSDAWLETNNCLIPGESGLTHYLFGGTAKHPYDKPLYQARLRTSSVKLLDDFPPLPQSAAAPVEVNDYRYKTANAERIYNHADYALKAGENWRSGADPALLAQARKYLKNGPRINDFANGKNIVAWFLGALLLVPMGIMLLSKQEKPKKAE